MPTGYTAKIHDGEQSFEDFTWGCARAFGALIHMREDGLDAPLRLSDETEKNDYYADSMKRDREELARLGKLKRSECDREAAAEYAKAMDEHMKYEATKKGIRERYRAMLDRALAWEPPSTEHAGLKNFMVQQLQESLRWDCSPSEPPKRHDGYSWVQGRLDSLARSIQYDSEQSVASEKRRLQRREWLDALVRSVPLPGKRK